MSDHRLDKFTERSRKVLTDAQGEAQRLKHNYVGTEHLLLALVKEEEGLAAKTLVSLEVNLQKIIDAVVFIIGRGDRTVYGEIGLTPRMKKVIELAVDESTRLGSHYIGTEHLLLGLVREGDGVAAGVLDGLGVTLERLRAEITRLTHKDIPLKTNLSLTEPEKELIRTLGDWWNKYCALPNKLSGESEEVGAMVNNLHRVIMARVAERSNPEEFHLANDSNR